MSDIVAIAFIITGNCDESTNDQVKNMVAAMSVLGHAYVPD